MNHFPTAALLTLLLTSSLLGHDFWIRPSLFFVEPDTLVTVRLLVGDHLKGSPLRRDPSHIRHFVVHGPGGRQQIPGRDGTDPAGLLRPQQKGSYVIGYRSHRRRSVLPAERFQSYLEEGRSGFSIRVARWHIRLKVEGFPESLTFNFQLSTLNREPVTSNQ